MNNLKNSFLQLDKQTACKYKTNTRIFKLKPTGKISERSQNPTENLVGKKMDVLRLRVILETDLSH